MSFLTRLSTGSWFLRFRLENTPDFDTLWNSHPSEYGKVRTPKGYSPTPRWHASYGKDYTFSGQTLGSKGTTLPKDVYDLLDTVNKTSSWHYPQNGQFNQILVNWYANGHHYIGAHSDDESQLVPGSCIFSMSLGATRKFRIRDKKTKKIVADIELEDGTVVIMGGDFQKEFTHEIVKIAGKKGEDVGKRINITFRKFK